MTARPSGSLESLGVAAKHVERPTKESEAQQVLARAFKEKLTVLPVGGATAISAGTLPERVDIVLDMTGMEGIAHFDISNLNMTVLAGTTLDGINEFLAGQGNGFFLPLDPPFSERATIGGVYASNGSGPSRLRYGTVRDQVLGVRGIDAQGDEVGFGGKTVKNVSGYDLTKFLIGSAGSLCLITAAIMRVYPLPAASSLCEVTFPAVGELEKFLQGLRSSVLLPSGSNGRAGKGGLPGPLRLRRSPPRRGTGEQGLPLHGGHIRRQGRGADGPGGHAGGDSGRDRARWATPWRSRSRCPSPRARLPSPGSRTSPGPRRPCSLRETA